MYEEAQNSFGGFTQHARPQHRSWLTGCLQRILVVDAASEDGRNVPCQRRQTMQYHIKVCSH